MAQWALVLMQWVHGEPRKVQRNMISKSLFIYTETSLHAGVGSTTSVIDLPIQRERTTQFPMVQGSGIKGALRSQVNETLGEDNIQIIFGGEETDSKDNKRKVNFAGAIAVGDARIVLFPVRSLMGVFAYITCPAVLARVKRDVSNFPDFLSPTNDETALVTSSSKVIASNRVVLEEFSFSATPDSSVDKVASWLATHALPQETAYNYWREKVKNSLVILPDDAFRDFVLNSTEVVTRIKIDSTTKTVANGALWTQEALPSDTLLMSTVIVRSSRNHQTVDAAEVSQRLMKGIPNRIQIGGDETTGSGMVALQWQGGN